MENIVRDNRNYKASHYHRKILPLISFGLLLVILGQQVFFSHSVQAAHIDQALSGRLRQRELAHSRIETEKRKKSKKSKSRKNSNSGEKSAKAESKVQTPAPAPQQESAQQPAQQEAQAQSAQDTRQESQQDNQQTQQVQQQQQQVQESAEQSAPAPSQQPSKPESPAQPVQQQQDQAYATAEIAEFTEQDNKFKPKTQSKFTPSMERQHRSPLQLPDISVTGDEVHQETVDDISKATKSEMEAYSQVIALDDEAQAKFLQQMEPKPVNAEEDTGGMAQFMLDVSQQSQSLEGTEQKEEIVEQPVQAEADDTPQTGADFAAELAQKYEAQQKEREAGRGVAEKIANSWYQNSAPSQPVQRQSQSKNKYQEESDPINQEAIEIDY